MSVFRVRKVAFINFGLLFIFLASWISWYMYPLARSVTKEFSFEYGFEEERDPMEKRMSKGPRKEPHKVKKGGRGGRSGASRGSALRSGSGRSGTSGSGESGRFSGGFAGKPKKGRSGRGGGRGRR